MSLEDVLQENNKLLEQSIKATLALVNALGSSGGVAGATGADGAAKRSPGRPPKAAPASRYTKEEVESAAGKIKVEKGVPAIRAIIKQAGFEKLSELLDDASKWDNFMDLCQKAQDSDDDF